ncbi:MAG: GNAT family N-acetyltransferase, partial [Albidovulum sp.]|uniref:GNAT family N-acetyltransferase n=1 Tax=Albidovulum sp. TaxID=1872424 RepID=UPI00132A507E
MTAGSGRLARIHGESFTVPRPWTAAEIDGLLAMPGTFLIEAPDGFLIGRALAGEAELLTLAVAPDARRRGTGTALVAAFLDRAVAAGAERAFLEVSADNAAARVLYARAGFAEAGRRR